MLSGERGYGFAVGDYDPDRELVIDPSLAYSTLLGGTSHEIGSGIQVDAAGNAYVTGFTQSPNFPTTAGAFDRTGSASNNLDAFVTKLNPAGTALVYSTFLGGGNSEWGRDIAIDPAGSAYVTGKTMSSNFPTTGGAFDRTFNVDNCPRCGIDQVDAFVAKLNANGSSLVYSTFLGGTQPDETFGIAIDGARNAYVTGETVSGNFPTTAGAFDRTAGGGSDAFVAKLNATGSALVYSTRLGGADNELPEDLAVDAAGNATVGGSTRSADFPTTPGAFDTTHNGGAFDERFDLFVTKLNSAGSGLAFSTFVGGSKSDFGDDLALDAAGNAYLVGGTLSPDFPTTPGTFDPVFGGGERGVRLQAQPGRLGARLLDVPGRGRRVGRRARRGRQRLARRRQRPERRHDARRVRPVLQRRRGRRVRGQAERERVGAAVRELPRRVRVRHRQRRGARRAGNVYLTGHTYSADFTTTPGRVRSRLGRRHDDLLGRRLRGQGRRRRHRAAAERRRRRRRRRRRSSSPADGAVVAQPVTFDWSDVSGAVSYTIQVDEISAFGAPLILSASTAASQFTTSSLPDGWNWFWRVRAVNAEGTPGAWSAVRTITVQSTPPPPPPPVPGAPSLASPADGAQVTQPFTFDWSDVADAAWYMIEADDSASFAAPLVWAATTTPSQLADQLAAQRHARSGACARSTPTASAVRTRPSARSWCRARRRRPGRCRRPRWSARRSDARFSPGQSITFDWGDVAGAASYTIQIDDSESFSAPQTVNQTLAFSSLTTSSLPTRRMWWRVRANNGSGGAGAWSSARRFEVKN